MSDAGVTEQLLQDRIDALEQENRNLTRDRDRWVNLCGDVQREKAVEMKALKATRWMRLGKWLRVIR